MSKQTFPKGQTVDIRASFTDPNNNDEFLDPTTLTLKVKAPDGTSITDVYGVGSTARESLGHFLYVLTLAQEGTYHWRWTGTTSTKTIVLQGTCDSVQTVDF